MKLKKIASLMLAGVMAASMLAGCKTANDGGNGGNVDGEGEGDNTGVSTGISSTIKADLDNRITGVESNIVFRDDADLDANLEYAAGFAGVDDALKGFVTKNLKEIKCGKVLDTLEARVGMNDNYNTSITIDTIGTDDELAKAEPTGVSMHDEAAVRLYAISSVIPQENINELIADDLDKLIDADQNDKYECVTNKDDNFLYSTSDSDTNSSKFNHTYTISVSSYTKSVGGASLGILDADLIGGEIDLPIVGSVSGVVGDATGVQVGAEDAAVTFVAVQVVRSSEHQ